MTLHLYRDPYTPAWHEKRRKKFLLAAVAPANVEEVQAVVKVANQYKLPLWPVSTGKNLAYGGTSPALSGTAVFLDLKRMDRILEVNERNHYALVEPGVSYFDLYRHIQENKLKVWIDPPDPGWGWPGSGIRSTAAAAAHLCTNTLPHSAEWKSRCRMANSCAPAWARC